MNTIGLIPGTARDGSHKAAAKAKKKTKWDESQRPADQAPRIWRSQLATLSLSLSLSLASL